MNQQQQSPMYEEFQKVLNYAQVVVRLFSVTIEVFLRHSFGERYLNIFTTYGAVLLLAVITQMPSFLGGEKSLLWLYALAFILMCIVHRITIYRRKKNGVRWHSRYAGTSYDFWKFLPFQQYNIQLYFEPLLAFIAGLLISNFIRDGLGGWLMVSALCLAISGQIDAARFRNQVLDVMDSQIESEQLNAAVVELKDPSQTEGFSVPVSLNNYSPTQRVSFADAMRRIDPSLRGMMSDTPQEVKTPNATDLIRQMQEKQAREAEARRLLEEEKARRAEADAKIRELEESLKG